MFRFAMAPPRFSPNTEKMTLLPQQNVDIASANQDNCGYKLNCYKSIVTSTITVVAVTSDIVTTTILVSRRREKWDQT